MSKATALLKSITIDRIPSGYKINGLAEEKIEVAPKEAIALLSQLLKALPDIPNGVDEAFKLRQRPYVIIKKHWTCVGKAIAVDGYTGVIAYHPRHVTKFWTSMYPTASEAGKAARDLFGDPTLSCKIEDDVGSKHKAKNKAAVNIILGLAEDEGLTPQEWVEANDLQEIEVPTADSLNENA